VMSLNMYYFIQRKGLDVAWSAKPFLVMQREAKLKWIRNTNYRGVVMTCEWRYTVVSHYYNICYREILLVTI
jgi:hypothetical protein